MMISSIIIITFLLEELSFSWNLPRIVVYEDEGIIYDLQIIKQGRNEHNISLQVQVDQTNERFEARSGKIYRILIES